jgi:DNA-binding FrmR family transcriptional regulator
MPHTIRDRSKLLARVRRIDGQIAALEKQLNEEAGCNAVLQQIAAIKGAVNGLMAAVIEGHLTEHIMKENKPEQRQQDVDAVLQVIKSYLR